MSYIVYFIFVLVLVSQVTLWIDLFYDCLTCGIVCYYVNSFYFDSCYLVSYRFLISF
jgi:hypothetical protein